MLRWAADFSLFWHDENKSAVTQAPDASGLGRRSRRKNANFSKKMRFGG
jgi:hypothetical protein